MNKLIDRYVQQEFQLLPEYEQLRILEIILEDVVKPWITAHHEKNKKVEVVKWEKDNVKYEGVRIGNRMYDIIEIQNEKEETKSDIPCNTKTTQPDNGSL